MLRQLEEREDDGIYRNRPERAWSEASVEGTNATLAVCLGDTLRVCFVPRLDKVIRLDFALDEVHRKGCQPQHKARAAAT